MTESAQLRLLLPFQCRAAGAKAKKHTERSSFTGSDLRSPATTASAESAEVHTRVRRGTFPEPPVRQAGAEAPRGLGSRETQRMRGASAPVPSGGAARKPWPRPLPLAGSAVRAGPARRGGGTRRRCRLRRRRRRPGAAGRAALHAAGGRARALRAYSCRSPARAVCVVCFPPPPPSSRAVPRSPPVPLPRADKTRTGFISPTRSLRKSGPSDQSAQRAAGARASPRLLIPFERSLDWLLEVRLAVQVRLLKEEICHKSFDDLYRARLDYS